MACGDGTRTFESLYRLHPPAETGSPAAEIYERRSTDSALVEAGGRFMRSPPGPLEGVSISRSSRCTRGRGIRLEPLGRLVQMTDHCSEERQSSCEVALIHPEAGKIVGQRGQAVVARKVVPQGASGVIFRSRKVLSLQFQREEVVEDLPPDMAEAAFGRQCQRPREPSFSPPVVARDVRENSQAVKALRLR